MNETQLKIKFLEYLEFNPRNNFFGDDTNNYQQYIEIKNEALNRKFDFILAVIKTSKYKPREIKKSSVEIDDDLKNIFTRALLFKTISQKYKVRIQNMTIYPIEIKSNQDKLDDRLGNQVIDAILSFGRSFLILDSKHCHNMRKNGLKKILPATIIGFDEKVGEFVLINKFRRVFSDSLLNINKMNLIKTVEKSNTNINITRLYRNLKSLQTINQKLIYNQIFLNEQTLQEEELRFIQELSTIDQPISVKKEILKTIRQFTDYKITDFTD
jgi:hypothetical protein